jgi:adenylosuccinate lyase
MDPLLAISVVDGRYEQRVGELRKFFSERALIKKRIYVENKYLEFILGLLRPDIKFEQAILDVDFAQRVKEFERVTNHDVKAVEYYMQGLYRVVHPEYIPFIHIGLTSEDVNSVARSMILRDASELMASRSSELADTLHGSFLNWRKISMLARTHGQAATPTSLGKEIEVFAERLRYQYSSYLGIQHRTKFGGATGGFNAMNLAYPDINWNDELDGFIAKLGLKRHECTTQVDHFDNYAEIFDWLRRVNTILIDLCQDVWLYCSFDYFKLKINDKEVGSSTMPHKVNPIDFENAEGNLKMSNAMLSFFSEKLPVSRLQRDLTDSTVCRSIGTAFAHSYLAITGLIRCWQKLEPNVERITNDLNSNYAILGEAVQTILRKHQYHDAYELIKKHTRNNHVITREEYISLIESLNIPDPDKSRLMILTPELYANVSIV